MSNQNINKPQKQHTILKSSTDTYIQSLQKQKTILKSSTDTYIQSLQGKQHMDNPKNRVLDYTICSFLFLGLLYILILSPGQRKPFSALQRSQSLHSTIYNMTIYRDDLEEALAKASTKDKTVIIAVVNKAYAEGDKPMLDLFLDGFWLGENTSDLIDHLLIVAVDQTSYNRCKFLRLHCYKLKTDGVDFNGEEVYMSLDFIKMMWRRTLFLGDVLRRGYSFIFTDTDVLWLRNPFLKLSFNKGIDIQISCDKFNGNQLSEQNHINTGFYMVRSNNKTLALFDEWYSRKDNSSGLKEQDVLEQMMKQGRFRNIGLKVKFLDTVNFSGFCEDSRDVREVTTVHANCCRTIKAKMADLTAVIHDWKRFKSGPNNDTLLFKWSNHVSCVDSWRH